MGISRMLKSKKECYVNEQDTQEEGECCRLINEYVRCSQARYCSSSIWPSFYAVDITQRISVYVVETS